MLVATNRYHLIETILCVHMSLTSDAYFGIWRKQLCNELSSIWNSVTKAKKKITNFKNRKHRPYCSWKIGRKSLEKAIEVVGVITNILKMATFGAREHFSQKGQHSALVYCLGLHIKQEDWKLIESDAHNLNYKKVPT